MLRRTRVFAIVAALSMGTPVLAQSPAGYYEARTQPLPDSLRETREGGRFVISVLRVATGAEERRLLERAESLVPPKDSIERLGRSVTDSGHIKALNEAAQLPGDRWWWRDWDGVLLPFALTGAAVAHYVDRVRALSAQPNPSARNEPGVLHRASVEYVARIVRSAERPALAEVHLEVKFSLYCGPLCGLWFSHSRIVEFDSAGRVIRVRGDGPPDYAVS